MDDKHGVHVRLYLNPEQVRSLIRALELACDHPGAGQEPADGSWYDLRRWLEARIAAAEGA